MAELQMVGGIKKLNQSNYKQWSTCIKSYFQGQDLWQVTNGTKARQPANNINGSIGKWQVKAGRAMFIIKTMVDDDVLDHIQDHKYPKQAWDTLETLFTKKNDARLQLVEGELMTISQGDLPIAQYFRKVKNLCREIGELDPESRVSDARMKRILIHGLRPGYHNFVTAIQGWATHPSITEFENILAGQEALAKQLAGVSIKTESEPCKSKYRENEKRDRPKKREWNRKGRDDNSEEDSSDEENRDKESRYQPKQFPFRCHM
ncbi:uncharacterized protein LOC143556139 [Bidens hawaiensis]|uniref:uncharacterized protein LOC143556139 n=1 Tax=Bidens hawaiensis TaxID=980011 RepID=UPI00404A2CDE